jgi:cytochrome c-type protein NapB
MVRLDQAKLARIGLTVAAMLVAVIAASSMVRSTVPPWNPAEVLTVDANALPGEAETFRGGAQGARLTASSQEKGGTRTLDKFDSRRAYPGAPPVIPHPLLEDKTMGGAGCLGCHREGGFVPVYKAYAPVTPHPDYMNCRQCHVPQKDEPAFGGGSNWQKISGPAVKQAAMPGAPPPIPHALQMRNNCVACHGGPGAVAEIRTPHPERANCRQCHVPAEERSAAFDRGGVR